MKKFIYTILALSIIGIILSALLLIQHFYPDSLIASATCGDGISNPCHALSISDYSTVLSIPIAAYGILFYTFILFLMLITDYAKEYYADISSAVVYVLSILGIVADFILATLLFITGYFCHLCIFTYAVNIALLITSFLWIKSLPRDEDITIISHMAQSFKKLTRTAGDRAALASFVLFSFLLAFGIFSTNTILTIQSGKKKISSSQLNSYVKRFYETKIEDIQLPSSLIVLGNPDAPVTIVTFNDFLCSACSSLYSTEKYLLTRYPDKVKLVYYNFPLDQQCNTSIKRTVYNNSCIAARAIIAAAKMGIIHEYLEIHFRYYKAIKSSYSEEKAVYILKMVSKITGKDLSVSTFKEIMNSKESFDILGSDIELAQGLDISATPTLFISGRRIRGGPPKEIMDIIINNELEKNQHDKSDKEK